jgi:hypothetical protein
LHLRNNTIFTVSGVVALPLPQGRMSIYQV